MPCHPMRPAFALGQQPVRHVELFRRQGARSADPHSKHRIFVRASVRGGPYTPPEPLLARDSGVSPDRTGFRHPDGLGGRVPQCNSQPSSVAVNVARPSPWLCCPLVLCSIVPSSTIGQFTT
jgi:hypothetical protein